HCFDLHHARHDRVTREMSLKKRLVNRDRFDADTFGFSFEADNAIHHKKWETMRQNLHHFVDIKAPVAAWNRSRHCHGTSSLLLAGDGSSQIRIRGMTRLNCHHMSANSPPNQREVADDVENFVTHEFVREP